MRGNEDSAGRQVLGEARVEIVVGSQADIEIHRVSRMCASLRRGRDVRIQPSDAGLTALFTPHVGLLGSRTHGRTSAWDRLTDKNGRTRGSVKPSTGRSAGPPLRHETWGSQCGSALRPGPRAKG